MDCREDQPCLSRNLARMTDTEFSQREQTHQAAARIVIHKEIYCAHVLKMADIVDGVRVIQDLHYRPFVFAVIEFK